MSLEGNLPSGNMNSGPGGSSYVGFDFQGSVKGHHQQLNNPFTLYQPHPQPQSSTQQGSMVHPSIHENFHLTIGTMQDCDNQNQNISLGRRGKGSSSDGDEPSFTEDTHENHNDGNKGNKTSPWQRVKWSDPMVKLLITAVSYIGKDASMDYGGGVRRKCLNLQKKGKWKSVSKVMAERGYFISPQQCEDKFNDLNKRYKRLNEILGRGTSCEVVEKPALLDAMDYVSDKAKEEVRKILSSKHLYYEEMCSYHNGNRLHLPPDPELQRSLQLALRSRDDHENNDGKRSSRDDLDENEQDPNMDDHDDYEEHRSGVYGVGEGSTKRIKQCEGQEFSVNCNKNFSQNVNAEMIQGLPEGVKANLLQEQWMNQRLVQLEEQKIHIKAQMLELEKERFQWQTFCRKKDDELEMMRMENERMKLENEQMALELKRKEMCANIN